MVSGVLRLLIWQHAKFQNPAVWACPSMCSGCGHSPPLQLQRAIAKGGSICPSVRLSVTLVVHT